MFSNRFGFPGLALPFYNFDSGAGSGGGGDMGGGGGTGGAVDPSSVNEPSAIDVDPDNTLIRIKGSDKPVKFSEHVKGFQAQATKAAQARAAAERKLTEMQQRLQRYEQERNATADRNAGGQSEDIFQSLRELPYLKGAEAAEALSGIVGQIKQRDMVLLGALKQMKEMQGLVRELHGNHVNSSFESKIDRWVGELGLPSEAKEAAKIFYLAHEGDDLDEQFPTMFQNYWNNLQKAIDGQKAAKLAAARAARTPFVPGRGGQAGPSKPLEVKAAASPKELADQLFGMFGESGT